MEWLNYHHLFYFWTVMHEGSVTAACKKLRLSPSTVSSQISKLEGRLDGKLFRRVGRGLEPTDLGNIVFRYAEEVFALGREMMDTIRSRELVGRLPFKVGVVDVLPKLIARRLLKPAFQLAEKVHLYCYENKADKLFAELALHNLDIVLSDCPVRSGLGIRAYSHLLGECGVTFFATKELAQSFRPDFPRSIHRAPMLLPLEMTALRERLDRWFESLSIRPAIVGEFDDSALLKEFGQNGYGIFTGPTAVEEEIAHQYHVQVLGRIDAVRERFYAISSERIIKHPAVTAISEFAHQFFLSKGDGTSKI